MIATPTKALEGDLDALTYQELAASAKLNGLAVDIETMGLSPIRDRVEVVSLATPSQTVVIALNSAEPPALLRQLISDRSIEKLFHHAAFDVGFLRYRLDTNVEPVFCTKVAARI